MSSRKKPPIHYFKFLAVCCKILAGEVVKINARSLGVGISGE